MATACQVASASAAASSLVTVACQATSLAAAYPAALVSFLAKPSSLGYRWHPPLVATSLAIKRDFRTSQSSLAFLRLAVEPSDLLFNPL